ncbi:MAG: cytochrome c [Gammaproteobacteria bacterium]|nr:cytochrome c [Gammaproteobacteria bacterium]
MRYIKLFKIFTLSALLGACGFESVSTESTFATDSAAQAVAAGLSHGEYVARLGNCVACHTTEDGAPLAGGLKMNVPLLGNIYTTNITPDAETGIGNYSFTDFDRAMRIGKTKDDNRMYPAMPYTSYAKMSEQDMRALYDFLMTEVEPVQQANLSADIPFWKDVRWAMGIWNLLVHDEDPYQIASDQNDAWNRGAYLTEGLGHCGACHTPRGIMLQEKGLDSSDDDFLTGAPLDFWSASPLHGNNLTGRGRWEVEDHEEFLLTGLNRFGTAIGTMVEVVNNSTRYMSTEDVNAVAVYLNSFPASEDEGEFIYDDTETQRLLSLDFSTQGAQIYYEYCSNCHVTSGNGYYPYQPALAGNPGVLDPDSSSLINMTLNGSLRLVSSEGPVSTDMPYFRQLLNDQQIADVLTYIRSAWGNSASAIRIDDVAEIRAATDPTQNDDIFVLRMK